MSELNIEKIEKEKQAISASAPGQWVGYWRSDTAGIKEMGLPEQYAVLLVMEGEITLSFRGYSDKTIEEKSLVVIDRQQLTGFRWTAGTAILEFTPPEKIFRFFGSCSRAFQVPCSTIVPVLPPLQQWIDELMAERLRPKEELTDIRRRDFCVRLMNILQGYPPLLVGELLVAFQVCAMSGDKKCRGEMCNI